MRESKAELTDRLRREGRFEAFKKRREELKTNGTPAKQAWYEAAAEVPPPVAQPSATVARCVDLQALKGKPAASVVQAATWAFEHLDADWVTPADAPSPGAWSLLEWARSSIATRTEFYRLFVAKVLLPPQEDARQAEKEREERRMANGSTQDAIERLLRRSDEHPDDVVKLGRPPGG
jgi:AraC-like DNA-binding protein